MYLHIYRCSSEPARHVEQQCHSLSLANSNTLPRNYIIQGPRSYFESGGLKTPFLSNSLKFPKKWGG